MSRLGPFEHALWWACRESERVNGRDSATERAEVSAALLDALLVLGRAGSLAWRMGFIYGWLGIPDRLILEGRSDWWRDAYRLGYLDASAVRGDKKAP